MRIQNAFWFSFYLKSSEITHGRRKHLSPSDSYYWTSVNHIWQPHCNRLLTDASQVNVVMSETEEPLGRDVFRTLFLTLPLVWQHMTKLGKTWTLVQHGQCDFTRYVLRREKCRHNFLQFSWNSAIWTIKQKPPSLLWFGNTKCLTGSKTAKMKGLVSSELQSSWCHEHSFILTSHP